MVWLEQICAKSNYLNITEGDLFSFNFSKNGGNIAVKIFKFKVKIPLNSIENYYLSRKIMSNKRQIPLNSHTFVKKYLNNAIKYIV